ncbi:MAG: succinyl-diaminopimelate desuccinylase [bacterium]|jgi:succinyl-diaminopimelate desuccinylase|nr:succinyl-diaminopimelate desuccinylase [Betaproteobacteria bacterium]
MTPATTADPAFALSCDLIARPSVTPEDAGCQDLLATRLAAAGFKVESLTWDKVTNLWARRGSTGPLFCFAGHTDVVPTGPLDAWHTPPFQPTVVDGELVGRGACDMKCAIAAMVVACERFLARHPDPAGSIAFLLTSDEEGPAVDGSVRVVEHLRARGERLDYCVIGEPTSVDAVGDMLKNGRRGSLSGRLVVKGKQGHIAYPHLAANPVHLLAPALAELTTTQWDEGNEDFQPTAWQVSNIHAGTGAGNIIPGTVEVQFNFRFAPTSTAAALRERLESILRRHGLQFDLQWTLGGEPFHTGRGRLVEVAVESIRAVTGVTPEVSTTGGTSDGRFIKDICGELIEFGARNATAHAVDERVSTGTPALLAGIYEGMLERLLAR